MSTLVKGGKMLGFYRETLRISQLCSLPVQEIDMAALAPDSRKPSPPPPAPIHTDRFPERAPPQALLINPGWLPAGGGGESDADAAAAALSRLPVPKLCTVGFVFIWAPKEHMHAVVRQLYRWAFSYVENLTWVQLRPANQLLTLPSRYCRRSHSTLLIFRRTGEGALWSKT